MENREDKKQQRTYFVYVHTSPNNKKYVGITQQNPPSKRWRQGASSYRKNDYFCKAIKKYGWSNFKHEIIFQNLTKQEAEMFEIEIIKHLKSTDRNFGYNISNGGNCKGTHCKESKIKISKSRLGKYSGINHPLFGKTLSTETKNKISKSHIGFKHTEASKEKMSINRSGEKHFMYGKKHLEATKQKISNSHKGKMLGQNNGMFGKKHSEESKNKMSKNKGKKVLCIETGEIFNSCVEASNVLKIDYSFLAKCCAKKRDNCKGLHFIYLTKEGYND